jgi:hypothetical protein
MGFIPYRVIKIKYMVDSTELLQSAYESLGVSISIVQN